MDCARGGILCASIFLTTAACAPGRGVPLAASKTASIATQAPRHAGETAPGAEAVLGDVSLDDNVNIALGRPRSNDEPEILVSRDQYVLSWNEDRRDLNWAAWRLTSDDIGNTSRQNDFAVDSDLEDYLSSQDDEAVGPSEFQGSCFDRGHQVPSGDRTASIGDNRATFLMSNMLPQTAYLNRVTWEHLEAYTRKLVQSDDDPTVYVIAGPIFSAKPSDIGPGDDIQVPSKNFKVVVEQLPGKSGSKPKFHVIAVIMPNLTSAGTDPVKDHTTACADSHKLLESFVATYAANDWKRYEVPLAQVEREADIDLSFLH